jgi:hypothetical protein
MLEKNAFAIDTVEACIFTMSATSLLVTGFPSGPLAAAHARKMSNWRENVMRSVGRNLVGFEVAAGFGVGLLWCFSFLASCGLGFGADAGVASVAGDGGLGFPI